MPARPIRQTPTVQPPDDAWRAALGRAAAVWDTLVAELAALPGPPRLEWKFYGAKHGWQVKASTARHALIYLMPRDGHFMAALALNPAALARLAEAGLPVERVEAIRTARSGPEGHPARIEVKGARELGLVRKLLALKLST